MVSFGCLLLVPVVEVFTRLVTIAILLTTEVSSVTVLVAEIVSSKN